MKRIKGLFLIILLIGFSSIMNAQKLEEPKLIKADGKTIDVAMTYVGPGVYDIDNDGLDDLICGRIFGKFEVYKNIGTKSNPKYTFKGLLQADGEDAKAHNW